MRTTSRPVIKTLATPEATHVLDLFRARPHILRLSAEANSAPGKLAAFCALGQAHEGSDTALTSNNQMKISISPTGPKGCFHLHSSVGGKPTSFLIDMGARVSLIAANVWKGISRDNQTALEPWSGRNLVGVNGLPLTTHGRARVQAMLEGEKVTLNAIVVSNLTLDAILGLEFLRENNAIINMKQKQLTIGDNARILTLHYLERFSPRRRQLIHAVEVIHIPPFSDIEALARVERPVEGTWLLEGLTERSPALVTVTRCSSYCLNNDSEQLCVSYACSHMHSRTVSL